jgi:hypothetical protein
MKRLILLIILMVTVVSRADMTYDADYYRNHRQSMGAVNKLADPLYLFMNETEARLSTGLVAGTGNTFYVDSVLAAGGDGTSWAKAVDTLQDAVDLCTADNGDVIYVAQGTAESIASSGALTIDCNGITIIGCGEGDQRPTYTVGTAATAKILVTVDDVYIYNMIFQSGKADLATCFLVTADDFTLDHCSCRDSTSGLGMITIGAADGDSDRFCIKNCDFYQPGNTNDHSIEILFDMVGGRIVNNVFHGDYDEGAIAIPAGGNACLDLVIAGNVITQLQASVMAININGTSSTGVIAYNAVNSTAAYECDPGALDELVNSWQMDIDLVTNNLDHLAKTTTGVVADGDLSNHVVDGTILSHIMTAGADTSDYKASTDSLEAIGTDTDTILADTAELQTDWTNGGRLDLLIDAILADTGAMDTAAELAPLVDPNLVLYDAPRITVATTGNFSGADYETGDSPVTIFTVTGDIKCRCSAVIGTACTSVSNDGTLELGITGDTACLLIQDVVDGTAFDAGFAWTLIDEPDDGSAQENDEWVVIGGGNDIKLTVATDNMSAGIIKFYLTWVPLSADAAVTASAP